MRRTKHDVAKCQSGHCEFADLALTGGEYFRALWSLASWLIHLRVRAFDNRPVSWPTAKRCLAPNGDETRLVAAKLAQQRNTILRPLSHFAA